MESTTQGWPNQLLQNQQPNQFLSQQNQQTSNNVEAIQPNQNNSPSHDDIVEAFSQLLIEHEHSLPQHDDATSILQNQNFTKYFKT